MLKSLLKALKAGKYLHSIFSVSEYKKYFIHEINNGN